MIEDRGRSHTFDMLFSLYNWSDVSNLQLKHPTTYLNDGLVGILRHSDRCLRRRPGLGGGVQSREYPWVVPVEIKLPIFVLTLFLDHGLQQLLRILILLQGQRAIQV